MNPQGRAPLPAQAAPTLRNYNHGGQGNPEEGLSLRRASFARHSGACRNPVVLPLYFFSAVFLPMGGHEAPRIFAHIRSGFRHAPE